MATFTRSDELRWPGLAILESEQPFHPIGQAVQVIIEEEWEHYRYAVRDLDAIEV